MTWKFIRKRIRVFKRWQHKHAPLVISCIIIAGVYAGYMITKQTPIDPTVYTPLLNLIAKAESSGNYNAYFGNSKNTEVDFTAMTITEVQAWQQNFVKQGNPSSAVGRYQIISTTLSGLVRQLGINPASKFDKSLQDRMAVALLERRGAIEYLKEKITREEFAANLAKEWAALPRVKGDNPEQSYYASDGLNHSRVEVGEILSVLDRTKIKDS